MTFELIPALTAGSIAAILMVVPRMGIKKMGIPLQMDVLSMLGRMGIHIVLGAILTIPYAYGFSYFSTEVSLWLLGIIGGFIHWIIAGALLGIMPGISMYAKNFSRPDIMGFLVGHVLFGLFVGTCYSFLVPLI